MVDKRAPKPMSDEARQKVSDAKKAWWAARKADPEYVNPLQGRKRSDETKSKVSEGLKKHYRENPESAQKSAAHREAIRAGKLAYEAAFQEHACVGAKCLELTRHHQKLCAEHLKVRKAANTYRTTVEVITQTYEDQDGRCATCNRTVKITGHPSKHDTFVRGAIDHDHATNEFRGILCNNCNTAIGLIYDNPETAQKLSRYLTDKKT